jgi:dihydropteroate synthase
MAQDTHFQQDFISAESLRSRRMIMGILNVTPDSFYDGGKYDRIDRAVAHAVRMADEGAAIIDIGAVSTRPGSVAPPVEVEWERMNGILSEIRSALPSVLISVDTFRSVIAERAVRSGANIINDISGGMMDNRMYDTIAALDVPYVLMHMKGTPQHMQVDPHYENVLEEVKSFFMDRIFEMEKRGIKNVILDPGFGFGKTLEHNITLLDHLGEFREFRKPLLVGISRKSMVTKYYNVTKENALEGTVEMNRKAIHNGANIIRVHDVKAHVQLTMKN